MLLAWPKTLLTFLILINRFVPSRTLSLVDNTWCSSFWGTRWLLLLMEACFICWGRATDTHVIKSATLGAHFRAKRSTSQIYTNGPLLFTGYNTAAQFTAALRTDAEAQMHRGERKRAHTHRHTRLCFYIFLFFFHSLLCFSLHTHSQGKFYLTRAYQTSGW